MYKFTNLELTEEEFFNLHFMNPPTRKEDRLENEFLESLCSQPLRRVAEKVIEESRYKGHNPTEIFQGIDAKPKNSTAPWFERHALISKHFHKELMDRLWIRNLIHFRTDKGEWTGERCNHPECSFYIVDGNHRALVYAVHVLCGKESYQSVKALHATSWDIASGILGWQPNPAYALENDGKLKGRTGAYKDRYKIHIDLYER